MDIKVNDIKASSQIQSVKNTASSDDSFKFTLISNIEEKLLSREKRLLSIWILKICVSTENS